MERNSKKMKRGQVSVFVLIALAIAAGVLIFLAARGSLSISGNDRQFAEVTDFYDSCLQQETESAISIMEMQGGRLDVGEYMPGSDYAPFSSHLNFLNAPVPYWFYVSGNGVVKENVPTKGELEGEIARYLERQISQCNWDSLRERGYSVDVGAGKVKVSVQDDKVIITSGMELNLGKEDVRARVSSRTVEIQSKLGKLFGMAERVYKQEQQELFLENYTLDVLRSYAPVDGVEISCSPKIWGTQQVVSEFQNALEANLGALKYNGQGYFSLGQAEQNVRFLYLQSWPNAIEIHGAQQDVMVAEPVGNQEGLGILGFCYSPYHFVYDVKFPVMVQVYEGEEIFQFPVAVIIDKNLPRKGIYSEIEAGQERNDFCNFKTQEIKARVFDNNLNPVDADIKYECFDQSCDVGKTSNGIFNGFVPACVNGEIVANAEGYKEKREIFSSNEQTSIDIILDKLYKVNISLTIDGKPLQGRAVVSFNGNNQSASTALPEGGKLELSEGMYDIRVSVYGNSTLVLPATSTTQCIEIASSGILGIFGGKEEKCFPVSIPETKVEYALQGGGIGKEFLLDSQLNRGVLELNVKSLPKPNSIQQLQYNYASFETQGVDVK